MNIIMVQEFMYTEFKRTKFNILTVLYEVGGLFTSLNLIGFFFTISFSYNLMMSSLIRKLYWFEGRFKGETRKIGNKGKEKKYAGGRPSRLDGWHDDDEDGLQDFQSTRSAGVSFSAVK